MEVNIQDIQIITNQLFNHLDSLGVTKKDITEDYYWFIQKEELYNPIDIPQKMDLGQLSDDWFDVEKILSGENDPISWNFVDLSAIFRVIGEKIMI